MSGDRGRRGRRDEPAATTILRVGRDFDDALSRIDPGDAVVINVLDLDRTSANALIAAGASAVINESPSFSGRHPVRGPEQLLDADIALIDSVGDASALRDGQRIELDGGDVRVAGEVVVSGRRRDLTDLRVDAESAHEGGGARLRTEALVADTAALIRHRPDLIGRDVDLPPTTGRLRGRIAVVVTAGAASAQGLRDLASVTDAIVVAAGDPAIAVAQEANRAVDLVVVSKHDTVAIRSDADGSQPDRVRAPLDGRLDDAAVLICALAGAELIVITDFDTGLESLTERPRAEAAAATLARLQADGRLVTPSALAGLLGTGPRRARSDRRAPMARTKVRRFVALAALAGLALGIVLGAGPLARWAPGGHDLNEANRQLDQASAVLTQMSKDQAATDQYLESVQPALLAGRLSGQDVLILTTEGTDSAALADSLAQAVSQSGGTLAGRVTVTNTFLDPEEAGSLDDAAVRLAPAGTNLDGSGAAGSRAQAALVKSLVTKSPTEAGTTAAPAQALLTGLSTLGGITVQGATPKLANLVLVVIPSDPLPTAQENSLVSLTRALAAGSQAGTAALGSSVVAGTAMVDLRATPTARLSTVDGAKRPIGIGSSIVALEQGIDGVFGAYGAGAGAQSLVPSATPSQTP